MRGLINGGSCSRHMSSLAVMKLRETLELSHGNSASIGNWRRTVSSVPVAEKEQKESSAAAQDNKGGERSVKKDDNGGGSSVMVPSYWGIPQPTITREDGTVWPWKCFMVIEVLIDILLNCVFVF